MTTKPRVTSVSGENLFFTSDTHFGHKNIIDYCKRPFTDVHQMNAVMIDFINQKCDKNSTLIHLGDVGWHTYDVKKDFLDKLRCKNVVLMYGNHDAEFPAHPNTAIWETLREINVFWKKVIYPVTLCHYPMKSWNRSFHGSFHLFGHVHGQLKDPAPRSMDVGVDTNNFYPYSWEEVYNKLIAHDADIL